MSTNMFDVLAKALQDSQSSLLDDAQRIKDQVSAKELKNAGIVLPEPTHDKEAEQIAAQIKAKVAVHEELLKTVPKHEPEHTAQLELAAKIGQIMKQVKEGQTTQEQGRQAIADLVQQAQQEQQNQKTNPTSVSGPAEASTTPGSGWAPKATGIIAPVVEETAKTGIKAGPGRQ